MAVRHLIEPGAWPAEDLSRDLYPSAPPPSPEVPVRTFDCFLPVAERLLDELSSRRSQCSPIPSIEISGRKESINDFSGSFSTSSSSSYINGDYEEPYSMEVENGPIGPYNGTMPERVNANVPLDSHLTHASTSYPIPNGISGDMASRIPHSWHPGMENIDSQSFPTHKPISHSLSDGEKTRRRSFSKRKEEDKVSCVPVEESSNGQDSMECEMTGKKSCQQSVIQENQYNNSMLQFQPAMSSWVCQGTQPAYSDSNTQYLQPPNPLPYGDQTLSAHTGNHRLSEPLFGSNMFDSSFSRSL